MFGITLILSGSDDSDLTHGGSPRHPPGCLPDPDRTPRHITIDPHVSTVPRPRPGTPDLNGSASPPDIPRLLIPPSCTIIHLTRTTPKSPRAQPGFHTLDPHSGPRVHLWEFHLHPFGSASVAGERRRTSPNEIDQSPPFARCACHPSLPSGSNLFTPLSLCSPLSDWLFGPFPLVKYVWRHILCFGFRNSTGFHSCFGFASLSLFPLMLPLALNLLFGCLIPVKVFVVPPRVPPIPVACRSVLFSLLFTCTRFTRLEIHLFLVSVR